MDPISALGLLSALVDLIEASNKLYQLAKNFKEGDRDLLELCNDVAFFEEALKGFNRILRSRQNSHNISTAIINEALTESSSTVQELQSKLYHISKSEATSIRRMKWLQNKSSVRKLHERMKTQSGILQQFLALAHASVANIHLNEKLLIKTKVNRSSMPAAEFPSPHDGQLLQKIALKLLQTL